MRLFSAATSRMAFGARTAGLLTAFLAPLFVVASPLAAEPLARGDVPEPLRPWIDWVLAGHEDAACPFLQGDGSRACLWPGRLALELGGRGGRFSQEVFAARAVDVPLPGGAGPVWPEDVKVGGERVAVVEIGGLPHVRLAAGTRTIEGRFAWSELPPGLPLPSEIGLVELVLEGKRVARPRRDTDGALWLREASVEVESGPVENRVDVEVMRRFQDAVPPRLVSLVRLRVSGETREERLGVALPEEWLATALSSPLPARLDPDGRLRVQLRPGDWTLQIEARLAKPSLRLTLPKQPEGARWDESEVWSVALAPELRLVDVTGAPSIDPTQAEIPPDWQQLAAYRLEADSALELAEKRRGNEGSAGDQLSLERTWVLDFDGAGATVIDRLQGTLRRSLRVEMAPGTELGRVAIAGVDQPITRRVAGDRLGIETTLGSLALDADSRIPGSPSRLAAVGWDHDVDQLSGSLMIPPGYRLLHASGVDGASSTWVSRWDLLSVFFVLLMTVVCLRLFGVKGALLALATLVLVWNEPGAPMRIWLALAVFEALRRAVARGRFARLVQLGQGLVAVVLVAIAVPFAVSQLRGGLFPALAPHADAGYFGVAPSPMAAGGVATEQAMVTQDAVAEFSEGEAPPMPAAASPDGSEPMRSARRELRKAIVGGVVSSMADEYDGDRGRYAGRAALEADPSAVVPTGPGRPDWSWDRVELRWSGPVTRDHGLGLWLVPPWANGLLAFLRVGLIVALARLFVRSARDALFAEGGLGPLGLRLGGAASATTSAATVAAAWTSATMLALGMALPVAVPIGVLLAGPGVAWADMPTPELLETLRNRLLENPSCLPNCAVLSRLEVDVEPERLRLVATIEAREETGVPLPGAGLGETSWLPESVRVDGSRATAIRRDANGIVWLRLAAGAHAVELEGALPPHESVQVALPLAPRRAGLAGTPRGWSVVGIAPDGTASGALQLVRDAARGTAGGDAATGSQSGAAAEEKLEPSVILPFALLTRQFELGLRWRTETRIERVAPLDGPIVLEIPLVAGESVTTPGIRVENGLAKLTLAAGEAFASYASTLEIAKSIELAAPADRPWSEVWLLAAAPVWHVDAEGIPPVDRVQEGARLREWRPWPGEKLSLAIERPEGLEAATRTIDRARLTLAPGARATDASLSLSLRSSQGGQHVVTLPEAAELTSLDVGGEAQPLRQEGREVTLTLAPGAREVQLGWREPRGVSALWRGSDVLLGAEAVNASVEIAVPENRWLLYAYGPRLGPSVLFWSTLLVVVGLAWLLARMGLTPLRAHHWLLLGLGMTQAPIVAGTVVVVWFLALGLRGRFAERLRGVRPMLFRLLQIALGGLTFAAAVALLDAIATGLLGTPNMRVAGNDSSANLLRWYVDRSASALPTPGMFSLSLWWYRGVMLAWSMWLALALVEWARWGFGQWSRGGVFTPDPDGSV